MRTIPILASLLSMTLLLFSCESDESAQNEIEGTYYGTIVFELENSKNYNQTEDAVAEVRITGDHELEIHCSSTTLDTIFRLNYFEHGDDFKVCLTGDDFVNMYHTPFTRPMEMQNMHGASQWMNHLQTMHTQEDIHFGEFLSENNSFEYTFLMDHSRLPNMHFSGYRNRN